jgi:hypothetical protein
MRNPAADEKPSTRCGDPQAIDSIMNFLLWNFKEISGAAFAKVAEDGALASTAARAFFPSP